ncbi:DUF2478 domain-containing protein [Paracoccus seriniphilus]|uniref:DUF2478 domain-containing protein n=1 Tax=Paracoccus seriniphilus TaxID=184748 RepID=A0A239Q198_9RHOB|nr:DUF2478 domain-containing protein [Paracoccus seriniphilus]WCR13977.1 DUF2478 domain-containing protein [Paracoccus seriniphilus]SNT76006.1 Protein of unknown function [Paracoccus seriniphilus]
MLMGWFGLDEDAQPGAADDLLGQLARDLSAQGVRVAGAVQVNSTPDPECACDMDVVVIGDDAPPIRISQSLGTGSTGCRLDPGALEQAAARVSQRMAGAELLVLPKFGRQEALGRGFCSVIAQAASEDLPVILHVPAQQRQAFAQFSGDLAQRIAPEDLGRWCARAVAERP